MSQLRRNMHTCISGGYVLAGRLMKDLIRCCGAAYARMSGRNPWVKQLIQVHLRAWRDMIAHIQHTSVDALVVHRQFQQTTVCTSANTSGPIIGI